MLMMWTLFCWLPRGAMDLNIFKKNIPNVVQSWLPRGAMDLNFYAITQADRDAGWLPRGAMDLNLSLRENIRELLQLAPSWSHGSKCLNH